MTDNPETAFLPGHNESSPGYRICSKTVMDTSDPGIFFNAQGESQFVSIYQERAKREIFTDKRGEAMFNTIISPLKLGRGEFNCICGVSGGVDSSLVLVRAVQAGLRPLAVHIDNGWNDELAVANIEALTNKLGIVLHTEVLDWESFRGLQRAFFRASVPNVEMVTDHAINSILFGIASKFHIPNILSGSNLVTEAFLQTNAGHDNKDLTHIKAIHREHGDTTMSSYPGRSIIQYAYSILIRKVRFIPILNYLNYDRESAKEELSAEYGWRDYGRKHGESTFTRFFQEYYLPQKFGIDKRRAHLSCQIMSSQITRDEALKQLSTSLWFPGEIELATQYICTKLGFDSSEWEKIMLEPPKPHSYYKIGRAFKDDLKPWYETIRRVATKR
jgi:N-acetyl sugar amidotransferase